MIKCLTVQNINQMIIRIFYRQDDKRGQRVVERMFHNVIKIDCLKEEQKTQNTLSSIKSIPKIKN
jgi:hypothetical protein